VNDLFSSASLKILESLSFTDVLYAFDFDGTLAPIVEDPDDAYMESSTYELISKLSARVPVAVISGRSLADLRIRVPKSTRYLIGNHGLEGIPGCIGTDEVTKVCLDWKASLREGLEAKIQDPGVILEDKGFSLAIHYRRSRKKNAARTQIMELIEKLETAPRIIPGKLVFNLIPKGGPHKGIALSKVMADSDTRFGFYIGDDYTDEDVFSMSDLRLMTVCVGNRHDSQAQYYISRQGEVNRILRYILKFHGI
jgi:trehalose 6-phosphate phosphatase